MGRHVHVRLLRIRGDLSPAECQFDGPPLACYTAPGAGVIWRASETLLPWRIGYARDLHR